MCPQPGISPASTHNSQHTLEAFLDPGQLSTPSLCLTVGISSRPANRSQPRVELSKGPPMLEYITGAAGLWGQSSFCSARRTMCHSRSSLPTMTILRAPTPAPSTSPVPRRGSGPEIFTFDPLPEPAVAPAARPSASRGLRKRSRRVLYPRVVRRQLPVEDPNPAKKLLFLLLTIVFCQILMAEEGVSAPLAPEDTPSAPSPAPTAAPPALEPLNLTSEPSDYALDLSTFLQQHPAAF